ncbi:MAG: hypothetical protein ACIAQZ_10260 [Sedimentisphaeraceae bacterium JB056]
MPEITDFLKKCLDDLEERIDPLVEDELYTEWVDFNEGKYQGDFFLPERAKKSPASFDWIQQAADHFGGATARLKQIPVNDTLESYEIMALQQYHGASACLETGNGFMMTIRSNYGTCIMPSLFGAELYIMPEETNTLPTNYPLGLDKIKEIVKNGVPDINGGLSEKVFTMGEFFREINRNYPKISKYVHVMHPDTQGVIDISELLWGSEMLLAFYEQPQLVKDLFQVVSDTYIAFMEKWQQIFPFNADYNAHWGFLHKGNIVYRSDSVMNISPDMYEEFVFEHQKRILNHYTGVLHFCGRGDHYVKQLSNIDGLTAVNLSQPEYNDMENIYTETIDKGKHILLLPAEEGKRAVDDGRDLRGLVHCFESF